MSCLGVLLGLGVLVWLISLFEDSKSKKEGGASRREGRSQRGPEETRKPIVEEYSPRDQRGMSREELLEWTRNECTPHIFALMAIFCRCNGGVVDAFRQDRLKADMVETVDYERQQGRDAQAYKLFFNRVVREVAEVPYALLLSRLRHHSHELYMGQKLLERGVLDDLRLEVEGIVLKHTMHMLIELIQINHDVTEKDLHWLDEVARCANFPLDEYRKIRDEAFPPTLFGKNRTPQGEDELLGLRANMSKNEKLQHLRKLYREWNAKKNASDSVTRENARRMVELIAKKRAELQ